MSKLTKGAPVRHQERTIISSVAWMTSLAMISTGLMACGTPEVSTPLDTDQASGGDTQIDDIEPDVTPEEPPFTQSEVEALEAALAAQEVIHAMTPALKSLGDVVSAAPPTDKTNGDRNAQLYMRGFFDILNQSFDMGCAQIQLQGLNKVVVSFRECKLGALKVDGSFDISLGIDFGKRELTAAMSIEELVVNGSALSGTVDTIVGIGLSNGSISHVADIQLDLASGKTAAWRYEGSVQIGFVPTTLTLNGSGVVTTEVGTFQTSMTDLTFQIPNFVPTLGSVGVSYGNGNHSVELEYQGDGTFNVKLDGKDLGQMTPAEMVALVRDLIAGLKNQP